MPSNELVYVNYQGAAMSDELVPQPPSPPISDKPPIFIQWALNDELIQELVSRPNYRYVVFELGKLPQDNAVANYSADINDFDLFNLCQLIQHSIINALLTRISKIKKRRKRGDEE